MNRELTWEYGVTTVPSRKDTYLPRTLLSLARAGFDKPRLFVDGARDGYEMYENSSLLPLNVTYRYPKTDIVTNWTLALWELYARNPVADRYALFQDDVILVRNTRKYLDTCKWPAQGYLNLTTFKINEKTVFENRDLGWRESPVARCAEGLDPVLRQQGGYGALALVFDRNAVWELLQARSFVAKRAAPRDRFPDRNLDGAVVTAMNIAGYREYIHVPSLTTHIGIETSRTDVTEDGETKPSKGEHADALTFPGEEFDAMTLVRT